MTPFDRPPPAALKLLARLPLALYTLRLDRLLGHRFLVITHRGRRTGELHRTVVEVIRWDGEREEATVASGRGERADWYRNLRAAPAVEIVIGGERFVPEQRFPALEERIAVLRAYQQKHPLAAKALGQLLGLAADEDGLSDAAARLPMVAFHPRPGSEAARGTRYLTVEQARRFYDRIGRIQDLQVIYEHDAIRDLIAHSDFEHAHAVFELGFGTGALALRLLERYLPHDCRYLGLELSPRMQRLASRRLRRFADRAELRLDDGSLHLPFDDDRFDRFVATYVLDLLSPDDIALVFAEARRVLSPGGLLCVTSLGHGTTSTSRAISRVWELLWRLHPQIVGGCRALELRGYITEEWELIHHAIVSSAGISSSVLIARARVS
jgi:deazaflavin-dependent oxidoreductase (nitroreductase family)